MLRLLSHKRARTVPIQQRVLPFLERSRRRVRAIKRGIVITTLLVVATMIAAAPKGRYLVRQSGYLFATAADKSRQLAWRAVGVPPDRSETDREWARYRQKGIVDTRAEFQKVYAEIDPLLRRLMRYAGNDPETGLLRWGNFNLTLLLPSTVFEADDTGRSYRLRPNIRAVWLRNLTIQKIPLTFFLVPEGPGLKEAAQGTTAVLVEGSTQTTNSWGLRGPEPDPSARLRGVVIGDSFMQGLFIDDDHTPPECLKRYLEQHLKTSVSVLNTGHLGYSPEQEFFTLKEYAERFHPQFVIHSLFANDFGDTFEVAAGKGDWDEGKYWLSETAQYCRSKGIILVTIPAPFESQLSARRFAGFYPGLVSNILEATGMHYVDPVEDFANENLRLMNEAERAHKRPQTSPLFNGVIGDGHFSVLGSELWASVIGRRLLLLFDKARIEKPSLF
jgi:hypothetical protein